MKLAFIIALFVFSSSHAFAQSGAVDFSGFIKFISKTHRVPPSVRKNCDWQYAVIKVQTNKISKITGYTFLNKNVSDTLKQSFAFLTRYTFFKGLNVAQRSIVFVYSLENNSEDCKDVTKHVTASDALLKVMPLMEQEQANDSNTLFIYQVVQDAI